MGCCGRPDPASGVFGDRAQRGAEELTSTDSPRARGAEGSSDAGEERAGDKDAEPDQVRWFVRFSVSKLLSVKTHSGQ